MCVDLYYIYGARRRRRRTNAFPGPKVRDMEKLLFY